MITLPHIEGFVVRSDIIANEPILLVFPPHISTNWNKNNLIYRSSIWHADSGKLISAGFRKFMNWGEKPDLFPLPKNIHDLTVVEKIDGSCLIISKYKNELIVRTRGTIDATQMNNGNEIEYLKEIYPKLFNNELLNSENYSIITEWVSPKNVIVLNYGEYPDVYLTGIIKHNDYSYLKQKELDQYAQTWSIKRPKTHQFINIDIMIESVKALKNNEGVCVYYNNEQDILKLKSVDYLLKHAFKSNLNIANLLDIYLNWNMPDYQEFLVQLENSFDYECMSMALPLASKIIDAKKQVFNIIDHMREFVISIQQLSRKDAAAKILASYGKTNRAGYVFKLLDNKPLVIDEYKKIFLQILKE